jgi:hypothetical protein
MGFENLPDHDDRPEAVALLVLAPDRQLDEEYRQIISDGYGQDVDGAAQRALAPRNSPDPGGLFHARYMPEMAVACGMELERPPAVLPSGWAALLYLFGLR